MSQPNLPRVLIVEDQLNWRRLYKIWLKSCCHLTFCTSRHEALESIRISPYDVLLMDLGLPGPEEGLLTIREIFKEAPDSKIIVVTAFTDRQLHLEAQKTGVYAVFSKDERLESELPVFVRKAHEIRSLEKENSYLRKQIQEKTDKYQIRGDSKVARQLRRQAENISRTNNPVLITGPTGAGKNYFARLLHLLSPRAGKPFVSLNCANLSPSLVESELFGHVRGAFTGAGTARSGKFKAADGGTLVLDEIGEIPVGIQAKLLQVIEEKSFFPVGSHEERTVDVRIMASTNRDLSQDVTNGTFRKDLYYRLSGFIVNIPPLQEHRADIPVYFSYYLEQICEEEGIPLPDVSPQVIETVRNLPWKGNLRELKNTVTRLVLFHPSEITLAALSSEKLISPDPLIDRAIKKEYSLKEMSALYAVELYNRIRHKKKAAQILGIDTKTLNRYLEMSKDLQ